MAKVQRIACMSRDTRIVRVGGTENASRWLRRVYDTHEITLVTDTAPWPYAGIVRLTPYAGEDPMHYMVEADTLLALDL